MIVYCFNNTRKLDLRSTYRRSWFWKKDHLFRWSSFWSWRVCKQAKLWHLGHRKADASKTSHCLVWSWNQLAIQCFFASLSGPAIDLQKMLIWQKKSFFQMKLILILANKKNCRVWGIERSRRTQYDSLFGMDFGQEAQLGHFSSKMSKEWPLHSMLNNFLFTNIEEENIGNIWFQQDGSTSHTSETTLDVLRPIFEDCIVVWPPRSELRFSNVVRCRQR